MKIKVNDKAQIFSKNHEKNSVIFISTLSVQKLIRQKQPEQNKGT